MSRSPQSEKRELWRQRVAQQESSGQTVRVYCRQHQLKEHSFYAWRRQLGSGAQKPLRFALVDMPATNPARPTSSAPLELIFPTGERLVLPADPSTLKLVLNALRQTR